MRAYVDGVSPDVEPSTANVYRYLLAGQFELFALADVPLDRLTADDARAWKNDLTQFSPATQAKAFFLLRAAMRRAVKEDKLANDPTADVKPPKRSAKEPNALPDEQRKRLAASLAQSNQTPDVVAITMALYTGMREREICGLRWRNVDLKNRTLDVKEPVGRAGGKVCVKEPKNRGGRRTVHRPEPVARALKARRAEMVELCMEAGIPF